MHLFDCIREPSEKGLKDNVNWETLKDIVFKKPIKPHRVYEVCTSETFTYFENIIVLWYG